MTPKKKPRLDRQTREALKSVRIPTPGMLIAGAARFEAIWNDSDESNEHTLVASIYEAMIDTAMSE